MLSPHKIHYILIDQLQLEAILFKILLPSIEHALRDKPRVNAHIRRPFLRLVVFEPLPVARHIRFVLHELPAFF